MHEPKAPTKTLVSPFYAIPECDERCDLAVCVWVRDYLFLRLQLGTLRVLLLWLLEIRKMVPLERERSEENINYERNAVGGQIVGWDSAEGLQNLEEEYRLVEEDTKGIFLSTDGFIHRVVGNAACASSILEEVSTLHELLKDPIILLVKILSVQPLTESQQAPSYHYISPEFPEFV